MIATRLHVKHNRKFTSQNLSFHILGILLYFNEFLDLFINVSTRVSDFSSLSILLLMVSNIAKNYPIDKQEVINPFPII